MENDRELAVKKGIIPGDVPELPRSRRCRAEADYSARAKGKDKTVQLKG